MFRSVSRVDHAECKVKGAPIIIPITFGVQWCETSLDKGRGSPMLCYAENPPSSFTYILPLVLLACLRGQDVSNNLKALMHLQHSLRTAGEELPR
eukprot:3481223-Pyramimonas_sp.AAC.2